MIRIWTKRLRIFFIFTVVAAAAAAAILVVIIILSTGVRRKGTFILLSPFVHFSLSCNSCSVWLIIGVKGELLVLMLMLLNLFLISSVARRRQRHLLPIHIDDDGRLGVIITSSTSNFCPVGDDLRADTEH